MNHPPLVVPDSRVPRVCAAGLDPNDPALARGNLTSVAAISGVRGEPEVCDPVIRRIAVDVVNLAARPLAIMDCPSNPMREAVRPKNPAAKMAGAPRICESGLSGGAFVMAEARQPREHASVGVIG